MFSSRRKPISYATNNSISSSSSINSYIPTIRRSSSSSFTLRQLTVQDLDETNSRNWNQSLSRQGEHFRIPRPTLNNIPHSSIRLPNNNSIWTSTVRPTHAKDFSSSPTLTSRTHVSDRPFYQIVQPPIPPSPSIQHQIVPIYSPRFSPIYTRRYIRRKKKYKQEKTPGLCATLCTGGCGTFVALIYLSFCLALPITKLVLGIKYIKDCPVDNKIPLYMIVSGGCGIGIILFLLLSSTCSYYRSSIIARKSTHKCMILTIGFARGMQGIIAIFLFVWFFIGNFWIFGARYRVQTNNPNDNNNNYCHPALYWFGFYVLIFTYVFAIIFCFLKFCANFFCCHACDICKRAFT
ncbi:unnamed protein product [Rotaria sordida]|uniref:Uncharacterized protein n=1 Tax=Rotaria sordida TaxID=392033 RepID=A0A813WND6_9BILA|nr:unnamed protein product [Rotaria sordida]CAF1044386.1 unnamed protein product [Rotaria sordida]